MAIVFFDIDGTLLSGTTGHVPASAAEAVKRLKANGHVPVINTGRPYGHIHPEVKALGLDDCVCCCGMYVRRGGQVIRDERPPKEVQYALRDLILDCRLDAFFEHIDGVFYVHRFFDRFLPERDIMRKAGVDPRADVTADDFVFEKFCTYWDEQSDPERFNAFARQYYHPIDRDGFYEWVMNGSSKGEGIRAYLQGIPKTDVYAFGDSTNDIDMFRAADVPVLMGNGDAALRELCGYVTADVDEDGIYKGLEHFGLI